MSELRWRIGATAAAESGAIGTSERRYGETKMIDEHALEGQVALITGAGLRIRVPLARD